MSLKHLAAIAALAGGLLAVPTAASADHHGRHWRGNDHRSHHRVCRNVRVHHHWVRRCTRR